MIVEMRPVVKTILDRTPELKKVTTAYPSSWNTFPMAIYKATRTPDFKDAHGNEIRSKWTITVEVYSDKESPTFITSHIEQQFRQLGFTGGSKDSNTGDLKRRICEFKGVVDNTLRTVHSP